MLRVLPPLLWPAASAGVELATCLADNAGSRLETLVLSSNDALTDATACALGALLAEQGFRVRGSLHTLMLSDFLLLGHPGVMALARGIREAGAWVRLVSLHDGVPIGYSERCRQRLREAAAAWLEKRVGVGSSAGGPPHAAGAGGEAAAPAGRARQPQPQLMVALPELHEPGEIVP